MDRGERPAAISRRFHKPMTPHRTAAARIAAAGAFFWVSKNPSEGPGSRAAQCRRQNRLLWKTICTAVSTVRNTAKANKAGSP